MALRSLSTGHIPVVVGQRCRKNALNRVIGPIVIAFSGRFCGLRVLDDQGARNLPATFSLQSFSAPHKSWCKDCGDGNRDTPIEQYMNESLFCR